MIIRIIAAILSFTFSVITVSLDENNHNCSTSQITQNRQQTIQIPAPTTQSTDYVEDLPVSVCGFMPSSTTERPAENKEPFQVVGHACSNGYFTAMKSPDGELFSVETNDYNDIDTARQEIENRINKANLMLERETIIINNISVERVVVIDHTDVKGLKWAHIITRNDSFIRSINAPTLQLALEFEQSRNNR